MPRTIIDIPEAQIRKVDRVCKALGISRAEAVRRALGDFVQQNDAVTTDGFGLWKDLPCDRTQLVALLEATLVIALIDTSVMLDYLKGDRRAMRALEPYGHCAISVVTWLELMALASPEMVEPTRGFLRSFERLSVSEAIADDALRLMQDHEGLPFHRALTWATANLNRLPYVTADAAWITKADDNVIVPYRWLAH